MKKTHILRRHASTIALLLLVVVPLLMRGGAPKAEDCPGGVWFRSNGSCGAEYWECTTTGDTVDLGLPRPPSATSKLPLIFEKNVGQTNSGFEFFSRSHSHSILLTHGNAMLTLGSKSAAVSVRMELDGGAANAAPEPEQRLPGVLNYFIGQDPNGWLTNVPSFARVRYRNVYPDIDVVYYGSEGELEHDFIVAPGADPNRIRMRFTGDGVRIESDGSASISAKGAKVTWRAPVLYQGSANQRQPVAGKYRLDSEGRLGFEVGAYDRRQTLVIDPVIAYATFIGRSAAEAGARVVTDAAGSAYVAGLTMDTAFPVTPGARSAGVGAGNILVTKIDPSGSRILYSTFLGGALVDGALGIALDRDGNIYVVGNTTSDDYPTTPGVVKRALRPPGAPNEPFDCVVTKLNASGNALLYSTYFGGTGRDACVGIAVDGSGNAYITGNTGSSNFPVTENAPQRNLRDIRDGFLTKLNGDASAVVYSTLFGGNGRDSGVAVTVDSAGAAYVTGNTESSFGFPITPNAFQRNYTGTIFTSRTTGDAFIFKMNPAGTSYVYSSYLGGSRDDEGFSVAADNQGNAYIAGNTTSTNFPTTPGAYQTEFRGLGNNNVFRGGDGFVTKVSADGTRLLYSTYLGGSKDDWALGIAIDPAGNAYVAGATESPDFPLSQDAHQRTYGGSEAVLGFPTGDAFVAHLNPAGSALVYSTYLGGSADEFGLGIALDSAGGIVTTGMTRSLNFPATAGAAQRAYGGSDTIFLPLGDVFVARFGTPVADPTAPAIRSFGSAANGAAGAVAPGEWIVVSGSNLGPAQRADFTPGPDGSVATALAGTRVLFDGTAAPVFYASSGSVQTAVPFALAGKASTQMVVEVNGRRSAALTIPVTAAKPTVFTADGQGRGQGVIINLGDGSLNNEETPAYPGDWVAISFTGGGQTSPGGVDGAVVPEDGAVLELPATVTIGEREVEVSFAGGAAGQIAGLYRADVRFPDDIEPGGHEVLISIGTARSQSGVTVAVRARPEAPPESAKRAKARSRLRSWRPTRLPQALAH